MADERFQLSLGTRTRSLNGRAFRIGYLGSLNLLEVLATIAGTEMSLFEIGLPIGTGTAVHSCEWELVESALVAD